MVVCHVYVFSFVHFELDLFLPVFLGRVLLGQLAWYCCELRDDDGHLSPNIDSERKRNDVEEFRHDFDLTG